MMWYVVLWCGAMKDLSPHVCGCVVCDLPLRLSHGPAMADAASCFVLVCGPWATYGPM